MENIEYIKNRLIDRILAAKNKKLLEAIENIFESTQKEKPISLSSQQKEMLLMSDQDIINGNLVSESELKKRDTECLK